MDRKKLENLISFAVPVLTLAIIIMLLGVRYETNDDATLANIRAGAYGETLHMINSTFIFALLMRPFYLLSRNTNWYVIIQLALVVISLARISKLAMEKTDLVKGSLISVGIIIPFAVELFYNFQYTKTSAVIITAGLLLIADDLGKMGKKNAAGLLLSFLGLIIRFESFFVAGMISRTMLLGRFFRIDFQGKKKAVLTMAVLFGLFALSYGADYLSYKTDSDWFAAYKYNKRRVAFSDYKAYFLDDNINYFDDELTDSEYAMLMNWDFYDPDVFTIERLDHFSEAVPSKSMGRTLRDTVSNAAHMYKGTSYRYLAVIVTVRGLILIPVSLEILPFIGVYLMALLQLGYLTYLGRFLTRNEVSMAFAVVVFSLFCISESKHRFSLKKEHLAVNLAVICACSFKSYVRAYNNSETYFGWTQGKQKEVQKLSEDKDHLYVTRVSHINTFAGFDVWNPRQDNFYSNIVPYGGWLSCSKTSRESLEKYGISRPLVDAVDNDRIIVVANDRELVIQYIYDVSGKKVYFEDCSGEYLKLGYLRSVKNG